MTSPINEQARQVASTAIQEKPASLDSSRASPVLGPDKPATEHIAGVRKFLEDFGGPEAFGRAFGEFMQVAVPAKTLYEAAGIELPHDELVFNANTGTFEPSDASGDSNPSHQAPNIAGPHQVPPAPG